MNPDSNFIGANKVLGAPKGMDNCEPLTAFQGNQEDGLPVIISKWKATELEKEIIANGGDIYLYVISDTSMPPVSIVALMESPIFFNDNKPDIYK